MVLLVNNSKCIYKMKKSALLIVFSILFFNYNSIAQKQKLIQVSTEAEPIAAGKFQPTWQSLSQYKVPEWFRNAKFGIWAHWGP